jgi:VIT1/CCC1 family predicted Fe2+/Mn2+ transporter
MHFQALAITCMALHYHSQTPGNTFHELMITSAAFGGYIVILLGIITGIFTGQPINKRIVRTLIVS